MVGQPVTFRTGGTSGGAKLLLGELGEVGERMMPLEMWSCLACGHVDLHLPAPPPR